MADGSIVYQGIANQAPSYLQGLGFKFGKFSNPADIFMKILSINYPKQKEDNEKLELLVTHYQQKLFPVVEQEFKEILISDVGLE